MLNLALVEDLEDFSEDLEILSKMLHGLVGYFATFCTILEIIFVAKQNFYKEMSFLGDIEINSETSKL